MNDRDVLLAIYRAGTKLEIEEVLRDGRPKAVGLLPDDAEADGLLLLRWEAATRGSIMLYDGTGVYEKRVDSLTLSDAGEAQAFCEFAAGALFRSAEQHGFAADVKGGIEKLDTNDA